MNILPNNENIYFSKGTWKIDSNGATCYNSGANFNFTTTAFVRGNKNLVLTFEMPNVAEGYEPILAWRINGLIWQYAHITNQMTITLPDAQNNATENPFTSGLASHYIEIWVRTTTLNKPRWSWNNQINNNVVILKSITIDDSASLLNTIQPDITMLAMGASFSEGYGIVGKEHADFKSNDATCSWGVLLGTSLGFNVATSGYAGSGFLAHGNGDSPPVGIAYRYMDGNIPRDWTGIDIAAFNVGSNDGSMSSTDFINAASEMIDDLHKRYPDMVLLFTTPFWGTHQSDWIKIGEKYSLNDKVICLDTVYPQLIGHPTISNYRQYILPDLVKKTRKALFANVSEGNAGSVVDMRETSVANNVAIKSSNNYERFKIKRK